LSGRASRGGGGGGGGVGGLNPPVRHCIRPKLISRPVFCNSNSRIDNV